MSIRLQPILNVRNVEAEKQFYVCLGFTVAYQADGFVALALGDGLLFGLRQTERADPTAFEQQMYWQFGVESVRDVARQCDREGLSIETPMTVQTWGEWVLVLRSPGGYRIAFEGPE